MPKKRNHTVIEEQKEKECDNVNCEVCEAMKVLKYPNGCNNNVQSFSISSDWQKKINKGDINVSRSNYFEDELPRGSRLEDPLPFNSGSDEDDSIISTEEDEDYLQEE